MSDFRNCLRLSTGQPDRLTLSITPASLANDIRDAQVALGALDEQAGRINGFRKANGQLAMTEQSLAQAKQQAAALAVQFKNAKPHPVQADALSAARKSAADLKLEYNSLRYSVQRQRAELARAGINTRTLSSDEHRLRTNISEKRSSLTGNGMRWPASTSSRSG